MTLQRISDGIHVSNAEQRFFGLEVSARMTVLSLAGGLLIHSPVDIPPEVVEELGTPRWVLAPNLFHHLYVGPWIDAGLEAWAAPGLPDKRRDLSFDGIVEDHNHPFGDEVDILPLQCFPFSNEVLVLHKPSRTLIATDLVFNIPTTAPWLTRAVFRCMGGYPGCRTSIVERVGMKRRVARVEIATVAQWDFDRLIMAHGQIIESQGKQALLEAFSWLGLSKELEE